MSGSGALIITLSPSTTLERFSHDRALSKALLAADNDSRLGEIQPKVVDEGIGKGGRILAVEFSV